MKTKNSAFYNLNPILKIVLFIFILILSATFFTALGLISSSLVFNIPFEEMFSISSNIDALILIQIFSAIGTFIVPAFIYSKLFEKNTLLFLKINKAPKINTILFTIILFFLANFVLDLLVKTMHLIPFEDFHIDFISNLLEAEIANEKTLKLFLDFKSPLKFIVVFFMMAILPGLGEELTFRGVFMNLFKKASNNTPFSILLSGLIFAIIHIQLHNFLAIFFMGSLLGYIYFITKNLWVSIIAHLINNGLIVIMSYLNNIGKLTFDFSKSDDMPIEYSIFGALIFFVTLYFYKKYILKERPLYE